jgi:T5SS/PEP-CTERM-associated repeat protein
MVISNGGVVRSADGYVGRSSNGTNCLALVTGVGSAWISQSSFNLGVSGNKSQVTVDNGGLLADDTGAIGINFNGTNN